VPACPRREEAEPLRKADTRKRLIDGWLRHRDVMRPTRTPRLFVGRADDMFHRRRERLSRRGREALGEHPDVAQVCVVPVADEIKLPVAGGFRRAQAGAKPSETRAAPLRARQRPAYAHPRAIWFVRTAVGRHQEQDRSQMLGSSGRRQAYARGRARRV